MTPLAEEMVSGGPTWTRCLPRAASRCTNGGRTTGISVTQEHVDIVTVFTKPGVNPEERKTVAGLLVLLTTLTVLVRPGLNFTRRVTTHVLKTLNRVVVLTNTSPGPETNVEKLATVLTLRKTNGGHYLEAIFRQRTPSIEFRLQTFIRNFVLPNGTPLTRTLNLTGTRSTGLNLHPTVRKTNNRLIRTTTRRFGAVPQIFAQARNNLKPLFKNRRKSLRVAFVVRNNIDFNTTPLHHDEASIP